MMDDLSKNFSTVEFACKCGCGANKVDRTFVWKLQYTRDLIGKPLVIKSGCRCSKHNKDEGGSENSDHLVTDEWVCEGCDIACDNSRFRFDLINAALTAGFRRIGIAKSFVHLGSASRNTQKVIWVYLEEGK